MKRSNYILPVIVLCALTLSVWAQTKRTNDKPKPQAATAAPKAKLLVAVFLGNSHIAGGVVPKTMFDSLVIQGLKADSGRVVTGFRFSYGERNIYEDSTGNLIPVVDVNSEYCFGDTLSAGIRSSLQYRTKRGDTAYFEHIDVKLPGGDLVEGRPFRVAIGN